MAMLLAIIGMGLAITGVLRIMATLLSTGDSQTSEPLQASKPSKMTKPSKVTKPSEVTKAPGASKPAPSSDLNKEDPAATQHQRKSRRRRARKRRAKKFDANQPRPDRKIAVESHATLPPQPLVAGIRHNHTSSQLHRLPERVLIRLMRLADPVSVECLRRTSRDLLVLFRDARPSQANHNAYPWARPHARFLDPSQRKELLALLAKDSHCSNCLAARRAPDWQTRVALATERYLHCSGCDLDHPACLFTPEQRIHTQHGRVCIGHQGYVRLCEHKTVSWRQIQLFAQDMQEHGKRPEWELVAQCEDQSHLQFCEWGALKGPKGSLPNRNWDGDDTTRHPALFAGYGGYAVKRDGFGIMLSWSAHLSLRRPSGAPLTAESLDGSLARLRQKAADFICPELERGQLPESWLFDPGGCCCLEYKELEQLGIEWGWAKDPEPPRKRQCYGDQTLPLPPLLQAQRPESRRSPRKQDKLGDEAEHWGRMRSSLAKGGSPDGFHLEVNALPCKGGAECLELRYMTMARLDGKDGHLRHMPSNWYLMLDPRSCEVTQDKDGFGVYWCEDRRCRNYWQYARSRWRPFLRNDDYIRACPE